MKADQTAAIGTVRLAWRAAAVVVTLGSVAWVAILLAEAWPELAANIHAIRLPFLVIGLALSLASTYLTFEAFAMLAGVVGIVDMPKRQLAHLHFTGQLLKHLPGRIWGVGYQWAAGRSAGTLGNWLRVNAGHMVLASFFALWTASLVLAAAEEWTWGVAVLAGGVVAYAMGWALASSGFFSGLIQRLPGQAGKPNTTLKILGAVPPGVRVRIFLVSCASWLMFYSAWIAFGLAYQSVGPTGGVRIGAYYMVAWFAGYISLLTPSGLGVRELVFAWIARGFSGDVIALMAILGRVSLLAVDILLGLCFAPFSPLRGSSKPGYPP